MCYRLGGAEVEGRAFCFQYLRWPATELVEKEIGRFLETTEAEVLCLRGQWGIGKTFAWKAFLKEAQRQKRVALKTYAYVSLFGLNSLEQLKFAIFENSVDTGVLGAQPSLETLQSNTARLARKSWSIVQNLPKVKARKCRRKHESYCRASKGSVDEHWGGICAEPATRQEIRDFCRKKVNLRKATDTRKHDGMLRSDSRE
jgi:hypothetical protein